MIDEATQYRLLKIYDHSSIRSAIHFIEEVRRALPVAMGRVQTDNGCPRANRKVERSHRIDVGEF